MMGPMKLALRAPLFFAAALSLMAAQLPTAKPEEVGMSSERLQRITAMLQRHIQEGKMAGASAIVARKGKVVFQTAQGVMDLETKQPVTMETMFRVASMTKPVTAVALLMLQDDGKVSVSDPVAKFIPEFANLKTPSGRPANLTIAQIMTHTSGLGYAFTDAEDAKFAAVTLDDVKAVARKYLKPESRVLAVVKANAYGHGLARAARGFAAADGFAVPVYDPVPVPDGPERAVRMALAMRERVDGLSVKWRKSGYELDFGVGIAQGYATIGAMSGFAVAAVGMVPGTHGSTYGGNPLATGVANANSRLYIYLSGAGTAYVDDVVLVAGTNAGVGPNLLVNGASGIAVGMATNIPPHNLTEVCNALLMRIERPESTLDDIMEVLPGPDFPTYGIIMGTKGIRSAYETGRGSIVTSSSRHVFGSGTVTFGVIPGSRSAPEHQHCREFSRFHSGRSCAAFPSACERRVPAVRQCPLPNR